MFTMMKLWIHTRPISIDAESGRPRQALALREDTLTTRRRTGLGVRVVCALAGVEIVISFAGDSG